MGKKKNGNLFKALKAVLAGAFKTSNAFIRKGKDRIIKLVIWASNQKNWEKSQKYTQNKHKRIGKVRAGINKNDRNKIKAKELLSRKTNKINQLVIKMTH